MAWRCPVARGTAAPLDRLEPLRSHEHTYRWAATAPGGIVLVPKRLFLVRILMHRLSRVRVSWPILLASLVLAVRVGQGSAAPAKAQAATRTPLDTAIFAGGCFWSMVRVFDDVPGVVSVVAGAGSSTEG